MRELIPKSFKNKRSEYKGINIIDFIVWFFVAINTVPVFLLFINTSWWLGFISALTVLLLSFVLLIPISEHKKVYNLIFWWFAFFFSNRSFSAKKANELFDAIKEVKDNKIILKNGESQLFYRVRGFNPYFMNEKELHVHKLINFFQSFQKFTIFKMNGKNKIDEKIDFLNSLENGINNSLIEQETEFLNFLSENKDFMSSKWFFLIDESDKIKIHDNLLLEWLEPTEEEIQNFKNTFIINEPLEIKANHIKMGKDKFKYVLEITSLPNEIELGFFSFLNNFDLKWIIKNHFESPEYILKRLDRTIVELQTNLYMSKKESEKIKIQNNIDSIEQAIERISSQEDEIRSSSIILILEANNIKELNKKKEEVFSTLNKQRIAYDKNLFKQKYLLRKILLPIEKNEISLQTTLKAFVIMYPFVETNHNDEHGLHIGTTDNNNSIFFDQFLINKKSRTNMNSIILGTSGSGKSTFCKKMIKNSWISGHKIFIIDPEREYKTLCENLGGNWINFSSEESINKINPLEKISENISEHLLFLEGWFKTVFRLNESQSSTLLKNLRFLYEKNEKPTMNELLVQFREFQNNKELYEKEKENIEELIILFDVFADSNSPESKLWNNNTNINLDNNINVFDIHSLTASGNEKIIKAQLLIILQIMKREMIKNKEDELNDNKLYFVIDEAHLIVDEDNITGVKFLYELVKRARKYSTGTSIITQNINDFISGSETVKKMTSGIINNSQYQFFFKLKEGDINDLDNLISSSGYGLSDMEKNEIRNFQKGDVLFTSSGEIRKQIRIDLLDYEEELWGK